MKELRKDLKSLTEFTSEIIKKHQIKELQLGDWNSFNDPRYVEGKIKEKIVRLLKDMIEIENEIEKLERQKELGI